MTGLAARVGEDGRAIGLTTPTVLGILGADSGTPKVPLPRLRRAFPPSALTTSHAPGTEQDP
jgi:hypothetical protein